MPATVRQPPRKRISRPYDLRVQKSRDALYSAILHLIETRPLEQITIKDITQQAGVSYPVFFRQFASKEELLARLAADQVRRLLGQSFPLFDAAASDNGLGDLCAYVETHRILWRSLLTTGAANAMRTEFIRIATDIAATRPRANPWLPADLGPAFVASGLFEILAWWLSQPDGYPTGNVVKLLDALIVRTVAQPCDIRLE